MSKKRIITGILSLNKRGFGFVKPDDDSFEKDVFIPKRFINFAMNEDLVEVELENRISPKGPEGKIVKIIKRKKDTFVGTIGKKISKTKYLIFSPQIKNEFPIFLKTDKKLSIGDRILFRIIFSRRNIDIIFLKNFGNIKNASIDIAIAIEEFNIRETFSEKVLDEVSKFSEKDLIKESKNREDFTKLNTFTIDPETAKDFDDALSLLKDKNDNYCLYVHIADVAHYVKQNSSLDKEAYLRGNSTYFPSTCTPMLPEKLSNNLCSLKENEIRLTMTVSMTFDKNGELLAHKIYSSFIKSQKRFTYPEAFEILENRKKSIFSKDLQIMKELCLLLKKKRTERGSVDFALDEVILNLNDREMPISTKIAKYDITHQIVEEFMLKTNEVIATSLKMEEKSLIYRIHPKPKNDAFLNFSSLVTTLGYDIPQDPTIYDIQKIFKEIDSEKHLKILSISFIKCMKLAIYSNKNVGHYGLALENYCHFTSPIRRYPDLIIQRLLEDKIKYTDKELVKISEHTSNTEKNSFKAESSVLLLKKLRLLKDFLKKDPDKIFSGVITKISDKKVFFDIENLNFEGLVDFYDSYDTHENFEKKYLFGDIISLKLLDVDLLFLETFWKIL